MRFYTYIYILLYNRVQLEDMVRMIDSIMSMMRYSYVWKSRFHATNVISLPTTADLYSMILFVWTIVLKMVVQTKEM